MSPQELIAFIFDSGSNPLRRALSAWLAESQAFTGFVSAYRSKIRAKVRGCRTPDDLNDLLWELEVARLLLKNQDFRLEYEAYGFEGTRSPDYRVITAAGTSFDVEAARIREAQAESRFATWEAEVRTAIRAVPSEVGVALDIGGLRPQASLLDEIEARLPYIKTGLLELIAQADRDLGAGESRRYPIPGAEGLVVAEITKPERKAHHGRTSYYGGTFPVWYTQQELRKFGDIVCAKLSQLRPGTAGLLAIGSRHMTHEEVDCEDAIAELFRRARRQDHAFFQRKGFADSADFLSQSTRLSAILFRSSWVGDGPRNFVWINGEAALAVEATVVDYLTIMD